MIAETMSLGILSLPPVLAAIGLVPGIILIAGLGILATYTGYVIGQFKLKYPYVHNVADAGEVMAGPIGREVFGGAQMLFLVFVMGSHVLTFSIMMNTLTNHGTCTVFFLSSGHDSLFNLLFTTYSAQSQLHGDCKFRLNYCRCLNHDDWGWD
jgi:amino acid permease